MKRSLIGFIAVSLIAAVSGSAAPSAASQRPFVVNGGGTTLAARPYQVGILKLSRGTNNYNRYFCGGSVVAPTIVVTAGHCTYDSLRNGVVTSPSDLRVLVNTDDLQHGGQTANVTSIIRNPGYDPTTDITKDDIALLILATPVTATPISIVAPQSDHRVTTPGAIATVSGWGCYDAQSSCTFQNNYPTRLRSANLPIHTNAYCAVVYGGVHIGFDGIRDLCAGDPSPFGTSPGACYGDSGGPLTIDGPGGRDLLIGIVSWGVICGVFPNAFTRISTYRTWLNSHGVPIEPLPFSNYSATSMTAGATPIVGDFDGDGHGDVLAYVAGNAADVIYRGDSTGHFTAGASATINGRYQALPCDTNNDTKTDLVLYGSGTKPDAALFGASEPSAFTGAPTLAVNGVYQPVTGDFTGDGNCDVMLYAPGSAVDKLLAGNGDGTFHVVAVPNVSGTYQPRAGDYNGDHVSDIYWYSATGASKLWTANGAGGFVGSTPLSPHGGPFQPIVGDFDGNGKSDIFWYGAGPLADSVWLSSSTGFHEQYDMPINGTYSGRAVDVNGDGADEILWYASNGYGSISRFVL